VNIFIVIICFRLFSILVLLEFNLFLTQGCSGTPFLLLVNLNRVYPRIAEDKRKEIVYEMVDITLHQATAED
jgi:hypothetical protein